MKTINRSQLRAALRTKYGPRNYRITRNGEVHVYGLMPNAQIFRWWLVGDIVEAELWLGFHTSQVAS